MFRKNKDQKRCLRVEVNKCTSSYEYLLKIRENPSIDVERLLILITKKFKTISVLKPQFKRQILAFFISNTFTSNTRLNLAKSEVKAKEHTEAELS